MEMLFPHFELAEQCPSMQEHQKLRFRTYYPQNYGRNQEDGSHRVQR